MSNDEPISYWSHAHRELALLLAGEKPLAVFAQDRVAGFEKIDALSEQDFATHVTAGTLIENHRTYQMQAKSGQTFEIYYWFYTVPGETWRVNAYCQLLDLQYSGAWCSHLEWLQGKLLGYSDEENRRHLSQQYPSGGCSH